MKIRAIEKVLEEQADAIVAIGGTEHSVVRKDRLGCLLRTTGGRPFEDYYPYTELARIEEDGLLSIRISERPAAASQKSYKASTDRGRALLALFAARYDVPDRPTASHVHGALAAEIWSINSDLPYGQIPIRVPSLRAVQRAVAELLNGPGAGKRRACRPYGTFQRNLDTAGQPADLTAQARNDGCQDG